MTTSIRVWHYGADGTLATMDVDQPFWLTQSASTPATRRRQSAIAIHPVAARADFVAVALVPDQLDGDAALNGVRLSAGMHGVRHGDRLELADHAIWLATHTSIEVTVYDPAVHGDDVFDYLTKARISPGEAIVACPGEAGTACNVIYTQRAWEMAMQSATTLRCANCGYRPDETEWQPTIPNPGRRLDDILSITNQVSA